MISIIVQYRMLNSSCQWPELRNKSISSHRAEQLNLADELELFPVPQLKLITLMGFPKRNGRNLLRCIYFELCANANTWTKICLQICRCRWYVCMFCMALKDKQEIKHVCFPYQTHYNLIQKLKSGKNSMDFSPITFFIRVIILSVGTTCNKSIYSELS